ncbi:MAG: ATPase [Verrucomicrobia bacterium RIFCSPHIGHO2_12_FULL_41_10]|nr:MAG: ATPase [Verrucomicrobia bacterium RIFCSPHIGHO2_12_FULL_41_10]
MMTQENIEQLKPFQARAIIEGLRKGIVPTEYVSFFTVGRQNWLKFVEEDLDYFIANGGGKVRFINGDYGDGKTHFMSIVKQLALQKNFASSFVVLTRDVPIHKFEVVYQEIVLQLCGNFEGIGIRALIKHWLNEQKNKEANLNELAASLREIPGMGLDFANALIGLLHITSSPSASLEENADSEEIVYQWFEGKKVAKKDLKQFNVFELLNKTNSKHFLQSLIAFLKVTNHKGLILFLDELETVLAQGTSIRNAAYENVRLLMDNTESAQYLQLFFSLIPDVLLSEKGFKSYDALWSRVRTIGDSELVNYRSTLVDLHKTPLKRQELMDLGASLRRIHEISYRWDAEEQVPNDLIAKMCAAQEEMGALSEVRLFIKQMIRCLDLTEQGDLMDESHLSLNLLESQKETEVEKTQQLEPVWDV